MGDKGRLIISFPHDDQWYHGNLIETGTADGASVSVVSFSGVKNHYEWQRNPDLEIKELSEYSVDKYEYTHQDYLKLIQKAVRFCETDEMKVVCSRSKFILSDNPDITIWCEALKTAYPAAHVYVLQTDRHGCWIGASPELLVEKDGNSFTTHSLAGTRWGTDQFTEKEYREQLVVTKSILSDLNLDKSIQYPPKEISYGSVRHLKSVIKWTDSASLNSVASVLHPTPAVCGYPKERSKEFIETEEQHDRQLYTGFIAVSGIGEHELAFVNLRCGRVFLNGIQIFAGGGVNAMSDPESEWIETVQKIKTISNVLDIDDTD